MSKNEIWKTYKGIEYDGEIQFSSRGRVKRLSYIGYLGKYETYTEIHVDRIVCPSNNGNGYKYVTVQSRGKKKHIYVHRAVAELFIPKVQGKDFVNHIDYDRGNNAVENLEWCTQKENAQHSKERMRHPRPSAWKSEYGHGIRKRSRGYELTLSVKEGGQKYFGCFKTLEEAQKARATALTEMGYGEYV